MKKSDRRYFRYAMGLMAVVLALVAIHGLGGSRLLQPGAVEAKITPGTASVDQEPAVLDNSNPHVQAAIAAQNRHNPHLLALAEVVGTAVGTDEAGNPAIKVFTKKAVPPGLIPESLDGIPVAVEVTGEIVAMRRSSTPSSKIDPTAYFSRPVPTGVSTGNIGECSAGTIGARVTDGTNVYALSNNHVYALENEAPLDTVVLQPGRYDTKCVVYSDNTIGTLAAFVQIDFSQGASNVVDAALAVLTAEELGKGTPSNGYGVPSKTVVAASLRRAVQKYGRTTSLTTGTISGINGTISVGYDSGTATFINQIVISSQKGFIKAGDSGSLLVTNDKNCNPVGLLFAGNSSGSLAVANPIGPVLTQLGEQLGSTITIDGK